MGLKWDSSGTREGPEWGLEWARVEFEWDSSGNRVGLEWDYRVGLEWD